MKKREKQICLHSFDDVMDFVRQAEKYEFPITIRMKNAKLNAKSFMGIISQVPGKKVKIEYSERNDSFENLVERYHA